MKKILLASIVFLSIGMYAQNNSPLLIQAEASCMMLYDSETEAWTDWSEWEYLASPIIIKLDYNTDIVTLNNNAKEKVKIIKGFPLVQGVDDDGDPYKNYSYNAVDQDGNLLDIRFKWFDSGVIHVYYEYPKIKYVYTGKKIEF